MTKRLIVCLDGTWNTPDDDGRATNVVKIMRSIAHQDGSGTKQITFYDKGVGTGGPVDRFSGGAFGRGVDDNIRDGYRFLANNYQADDEIYIFGFSRGAFTARSLAGFIGVCGLLTKETLGTLADAWALYRAPKERRDAGEINRVQSLGHTEIDISCVGVWDTVGALGIPIERLRFANRDKYRFHDTDLGGHIQCALHAIAIDEARGPFGPTLWQHDVGTPPDGIVEQVWFPGVHSNIGGSYEDTRLSDLTLDWMIRRVDEHTPLAFNDDYVGANVKGAADGTIYESRTALYAASRALPYQRVIAGQDQWVRRFLSRFNKPDQGKRFANEMLHQSALDRFATKAPFSRGGKVAAVPYEPESIAAARGNLPVVGYDGTFAAP